MSAPRPCHPKPKTAYAPRPRHARASVLFPQRCGHGGQEMAQRGTALQHRWEGASDGGSATGFPASTQAQHRDNATVPYTRARHHWR
eukprot:gene18033-biopygen6878